MSHLPQPLYGTSTVVDRKPTSKVPLTTAEITIFVICDRSIFLLLLKNGFFLIPPLSALQLYENLAPTCYSPL